MERDTTNEKNEVKKQLSLQQIMEIERIRCSKDPIYFLKKYYYIQHPQRGKIKFNLYPFQEDVLKLWRKNPFSIINKSRQLGISTLASGFSLWLMLFNDSKNVLCLATRTETAKNMVTKVKFAYDNLPSWMKIKTVENNKLSIRLENGSQMKAVSSAGDSARSEAVSLLLIDEAAFIDNIEEVFISAQQTLATGGGCIAMSTPYGTGNWFHRTWVKSTEKKNNFLPIRLPWTVHPERDEAWRAEQDKDLGIRAAAQECDCDFSTSGDTVVEPTILTVLESQVKEPIQKRGFDNNLWIWEHPVFGKQYAVFADCARGDGKDYSAFHVFDIETNTQVAEYQGQIGTRDYGNVLVGIATEYNDALLVIENANIGWDVVQTAIERNYRNLYYSPRQDAAMVNVEMYLNKFESGQGMVPGFTMSLRTRPLCISKMVSYINEKSVTIPSTRTVSELRTFIWKHGKAQAQDGYNDDLVMSLSMGMFLRDTSLRYKEQGNDMTRAMLSGIGKTQQIIGPGSIGNNSYNQYYSSPHDQWKMDLGNGQSMDLTWLI
jgi:hypothetical protein